MDNCEKIEALVNVQHPHLYSVMETDTYTVYCGQSIVSSYTSKALNQAAIDGWTIVIVGLMFLVLFILNKPIRRWVHK